VADGSFSVFVPDDLIANVAGAEPLEFEAILSLDFVDADFCPNE
jgi:hypothetical protein